MAAAKTPRIWFRVKGAFEQGLDASAVLGGECCLFETETARGVECSWNGERPASLKCPCMSELRALAVLCSRVYGKAEAKQIVAPEGWQPLPLPELSAKRRRRWTLPGLHAELWYRTHPGELVRAVLVFRGTTGSWDWFANLRWFRFVTRFFVYDHYHQTRDLIKPALALLDETFAGRKLFVEAAGHSLGGGLAQYAATSSPRIRTAYAFHSSPVTGFFGVPKRERDENVKGLTTFRVHQKGEILEAARLLLRRFVFEGILRPWRPKNVDPCVAVLRVDIPMKKGPIARHDIGVFAEALSAVPRVSPEQEPGDSS